MTTNIIERPSQLTDEERAATKKPGIYSFALFYEKGKECEYFIKIDKKEN